MKLFDAIEYLQNGSILLGSSNLSGKSWVGKLLYFKSSDVEINDDNITFQHQLDSNVVDIKVCTLSDHFFTAHDSGSVCVWMLVDEEALHYISSSVKHDDAVSSISINSIESKIISASYDNTINLSDLEAFTAIASYRVHSDMVNYAAFHPSNPDVFLSCGQDFNILSWDISKSKPVQKIALKEMPTCLAWFLNNEFNFLVGTETGNISLIDTRKNDIIETYPIHKRLISRLAFSKENPNIIATGSHDSSVHLFDLVKKSSIYHDYLHKDYVRGLSWNKCNNSLASCSWDETVIIRTNEQLFETNVI